MGTCRCHVAGHAAGGASGCCGEEPVPGVREAGQAMAVCSCIWQEAFYRGHSAGTQCPPLLVTRCAPVPAPCQS